MLLLVGQLLWGVHDMVIGSPWASAADVVGLLVGGWLARHCSNIPIALSGESSAIGAVGTRELTYTNQVLHRLYANLQQRPRAFPRSWRTHLSLASQSI
jgi:hypothetical protein